MQNTSRATQMRNFLSQQCKLNHYQIVAMNCDASTRKYYRIILPDDGSYILMDDEKRANKPKEFIAIDHYLLQNGIRAPQIFAHDLKQGFILLEDFGESDFVKKATPQNQKKLLTKAVDILIKLHQVKKRPACVKDMNRQVILDNFALFTDWYIPACLGRQLTGDERKSFFAVIKKLLTPALKLPSSLVLWDYHVNNVMYPDENDAAVIDFQDSLWGCGIYDLVSLIEDERRDIPPSLTDELKKYYFTQMPNLKAKDFDKCYAFMALLRHMRVLGRFTTLILVSKRPAYARYVLHGLELLKKSLNNPDFHELKQWIDKHFPYNLWKIPQDKGINKAFILAAGRGTRMQHLTDHLPKPMIEINHRRLMDYGLDLLQHANIKDIVVNVCYRKCMIKKHMKANSYFNTTISEEKEALETGGGIKKALNFFDNQPFVVINADNILIDNGYKPIINQMIDAWDDNKHDIMLLLCHIKNIYGDTPSRGDYKLENGRIFRNQNKITAPEFAYGYVGVAIIHPRIFDHSPIGKFSLVELFDKAQNTNRLGYCLSDRQEFWVGSPKAVEQTRKILSRA